MGPGEANTRRESAMRAKAAAREARCAASGASDRGAAHKEGVRAFVGRSRDARIGAGSVGWPAADIIGSECCLASS